MYFWAPPKQVLYGTYFDDKPTRDGMCGTIVDGYFEGYCRQKFANGDEIIGSATRGQFEGYCTYYFANGDIMHGRQADGVFEGSCSKRCANGDVMYGCVDTSLAPFGRYTIHKASGIRRVRRGCFVDGAFVDDGGWMGWCLLGGIMHTNPRALAMVDAPRQSKTEML